MTVNDGMKFSKELENYTFGISLGRIIGKRGNLKYKDTNEIKTKFGIPLKSKIVLIGTGEDTQLENMWKIHETQYIFERISKMGFDWVTSLTWSVWEEDFPRPDQIRNQQRNFLSYDLFVNLGIPTIPFLFLVDDIDFENAKKWLDERPDIYTVAIYARYYRSSENFHKLLKYLEKIEDYISRPIEFMIVGIAKGDNMSLLSKKFRVKFVNGKPFHRAKCGLICNNELEYSKSDLPKEDILKINLHKNNEYAKKYFEKPFIYLPQFTKDKFQNSNLKQLVNRSKLQK